MSRARARGLDERGEESAPSTRFTEDYVDERGRGGAAAVPPARPVAPQGVRFAPSSDWRTGEIAVSPTHRMLEIAGGLPGRRL